MWLCNKTIEVFFFLTHLERFPSSMSQKNNQMWWEKVDIISAPQPHILKQYTWWIVQFTGILNGDPCIVYNKIQHIVTGNVLDILIHCVCYFTAVCIIWTVMVFIQNGYKRYKRLTVWEYIHVRTKEQIDTIYQFINENMSLY